MTGSGCDHQGHDKFEAKIQRNVESGMTEEEARNRTSPPSPIPRHLLFIEGHKNKRGDFSTDAARDVCLTIDELTNRESQGESVGDGKNDILVIATGKKDHSGRIRGVGGRMRMSQVFGESSSGHTRNAVYHAKCDEKIEYLTATLKHMYTLMGETIPEFPNRHGGSSNLFPSMESSFKHPAQTNRETTSGEAMMEEHIPVRSQPDSLGEFTDGTRCRLFVIDDIQGRRLVATGCLNNLSMTHGKKVMSDRVKVNISTSIEAEAPLPFPDDDAIIVGTVFGHMLEWPRTLVEIITDPDSQVSDKWNKVDFKDSLLQLYKVVSLHPTDSYYTINMMEEIVGMEYPVLLTRENLVEFFKFDMVTGACMQVYIKTMHMLVTALGKTRIGFLSPYHIQLLGNDEESRIQYIVSTLKKGHKSIYLAPYFLCEHWMLMAIKPRDMIVYWFDPVLSAPRDDAVNLMHKVSLVYHSQAQSSTHNTPKWIEMNHKKQASNWECGYYVMRYMRKIIVQEGIEHLDFKKCFRKDVKPFARSEMIMV